MRKRITPLAAVTIAGIVIRAIRAAAEEAREARDPDSDGGRAITPGEALDIAEAALGSVVGDVADALTGR